MDGDDDSLGAFACQVLAHCLGDPLLRERDGVHRCGLGNARRRLWGGHFFFLRLLGDGVRLAMYFAATIIQSAADPAPR